MNRKPRPNTSSAHSHSDPLLPYFARASTLHQQGNLAEAVRTYEYILRHAPMHADALHMLGVARSQLGDHAAGIELIERALSVRPDDASAWLNLGSCQNGARHYADALRSLDTAIELAPGNANAHNNRAIALAGLARHDEAISACRQALQLKPAFAEAFNNLGNAQRALGQHDAAIATFEALVSQHPRYADAYNNLGMSLADVHRHEEALQAYARARALHAQHVGAHWNAGISHLLLGQFEQGWPLFEWHRKLPGNEPERHFTQAPWRGEPLAGKRILLWAEQGLGDTIQMCRYAPMLAAQGAEVILEVQPALLGILRSLDGIAQLIAHGNALPDTDFHCPLMSLPGRCATRPDNIPVRTRYLSTPAEQHTSGPVSTHGRRRIGITCSGNPRHHDDRNRSIPLQQFTPLLALDIEWHFVQTECSEEDARFLASASKLQDHRQQLKDFTDTARLLETLDLLISVDTSVAHLAGALGKPVWLLLPYSPDWRWMLERTDSPWYPSFHLFRQLRPADWSDVIKRLSNQLSPS